METAAEIITKQSEVGNVSWDEQRNNVHGLESVLQAMQTERDSNFQKLAMQHTTTQLTGAWL